MDLWERHEAIGTQMPADAEALGRAAAAVANTHVLACSLSAERQRMIKFCSLVTQA